MENVKKNSMLRNLKIFFYQEIKITVCKLKKELYGIKQAPRAWFSRLDKYLKQQGYIRGALTVIYT